MTYTTLNQIREHSPCKDGWEKLLKHLNKTVADDEPLELTTVLESNGFKDAIWCLKTLKEGIILDIKYFTIDCAELVLPIFEAKYPEDLRPRKAIEATKNYLVNKISLDELKTAAAAACDAYSAAATYAAAYSASAAAYCATYAATYAADTAYSAYNATYAATYAADTASAYSGLNEVFIKHFGKKK